MPSKKNIISKEMTPQPPSQFLERKLEQFNNLDWPMNVAGTGVDMEFCEYDRLICEFLKQYHSELIQEILQVGEGMIIKPIKESSDADPYIIQRNKGITEYQSKIKSL